MVTDRLTIDELARRTGMTVRNIRAHQSRGLLPPPEVRGRTGYYGAEHTARIELIRELQGEGFNLESIKRLLEGTAGASTDVLRFTRALREPFEEAGRPGESWPEVHEALERLRPLASESLLGVFQLAMGDAVDKAFGEILERDSGRKRR